MFQVIMIADGRTTVVYVGTEKLAWRRCEKLRKSETVPRVGYAVVQARVQFSDPKTTHITNHN